MINDTSKMAQAIILNYRESLHKAIHPFDILIAMEKLYDTLCKVTEDEVSHIDLLTITTTCCVCRKLTSTVHNAAYGYYFKSWMLPVVEKYIRVAEEAYFLGATLGKEYNKIEEYVSIPSKEAFAVHLKLIKRALNHFNKDIKSGFYKRVYVPQIDYNLEL